jgi:trk system potassium uptake protein TrkA
MRVVILGAGALAVTTARLLLRHDHEVIIVERDKERIDELSGELDCGFIYGDGTKPSILKEVEPKRSDALLCLSGDDQSNILGGLVGRHLGFPRVVTKVEDPELEHLCVELGLEDTIIPNRTIARSLSDLLVGYNVPELATIITGDVRFFSFAVGEADAGKIADLELPKGVRFIGVSREDKFLLLDEDDRLEANDAVLVITPVVRLDDLRERFGGQPGSRPDAKEKSSA